MKLNKYLLLGLGALLAAVSFAPWYVWPAGLLFLVPAIHLARSEKLSVKQSVRYGLLTGLVINVLAYHWVIHTIEVYGHLPLIPSLLIFILYALGTSLRYVFFFLLLRFFFHSERFEILRSKRIRIITSPYFFIPLAWGISECAGWQLFPYYAASLAGGNNYLVQITDILGIKGLSLIIVFLNAGFSEIMPDIIGHLKEKTLRKYKFNAAGLSTIFAFFILLVYGFFTEQHYSRHQSPKTVLIGVPQGNTPLAFQSGRDVYSELQRITSEMVRQTTDIVDQSVTMHGRKPDLIVWPESSVPFVSLQSTAFFADAMQNMINSIKVPVIINDVYRDRAQRKDYSNMWFLSETGRPAGSYQKKFLLPFGEFMPLGNHFPALKNLFPEVSDFSPGTRFEIFEQNGTRYMPLVCYEVILPGYTREFFNATGSQADILVNITNDAWFGRSIESAQHLELGRIRSIELRRPMIRATNSGITGYIDAAGNVHGKTGLFVRDSRLYEVPANTRHFTLYAFWGDFPVYLFLLVGTLGLTYFFFRYRA